MTGTATMAGFPALQRLSARVDLERRVGRQQIAADALAYRLGIPQLTVGWSDLTHRRALGTFGDGRVTLCPTLVLRGPEMVAVVLLHEVAHAVAAASGSADLEHGEAFGRAARRVAAVLGVEASGPARGNWPMASGHEPVLARRLIAATKLAAGGHWAALRSTPPNEHGQLIAATAGRS